jgi:polar amino acid transport system substrate-binding protein
MRTDTLDSSFDQFVAGKLDVLAGLRPRLIEDVKRLPGARILDGQFSAVQQAVGTAKKNAMAAAWLSEVVEDCKASGLVARLIAKHKAVGLSVAPKA